MEGGGGFGGVSGFGFDGLSGFSGFGEVEVLRGLGFCAFEELVDVDASGGEGKKADRG